MLLRDYLTADVPDRDSWSAFKRRLAEDVVDAASYGKIQTHAWAILMRAAERWSRETGWRPGFQRPQKSRLRPESLDARPASFEHGFDVKYFLIPNAVETRYQEYVFTTSLASTASGRAESENMLATPQATA